MEHYDLTMCTSFAHKKSLMRSMVKENGIVIGTTWYNRNFKCLYRQHGMNMDTSGHDRFRSLTKSFLFLLHVHIGLGPRTFRKKAVDCGDRSVWTDTPSDKMKKQVCFKLDINIDK